jgi:hypothetical protein
MAPITLIILIASIVCILVIAWHNRQVEKQRQKVYYDWAKRHRWSYDSNDCYNTYQRYSFLSQLHRGSNRSAFDILKGTWKGYSVEAFNFHYETYHTSSTNESTTTETTHNYMGVVIIKFKKDFPHLIISPKNAFEKFASKLGFGKNKVKSIKFSQAFNIYCNNERFIRDFCHPRMIDYFLANYPIKFELQSNIAVVYDQGKMTPEDVENHLIELYYLRLLLPLQ